MTHDRRCVIAGCAAGVAVLGLLAWPAAVRAGLAAGSRVADCLTELVEVRA